MNDAVALNQEQSGMATMVVRDTEKYHAMASLQLGIPFTYVILSYTRKMTEQKQKLRAAIKVNVKQNNTKQLFGLPVIAGRHVWGNAGVRSREEDNRPLEYRSHYGGG